MQMEDHTGVAFAAGAAALKAFCALVLEDPALQAELRPSGCSEQEFMTRVLNAARQRGFAFGPEDVRQLMQQRMLAGVIEIAVKETPLPSDGWLPVRATWQ